MTPDFRIGLGLDTHRLEPGRPCRLGGVEIPSAVGPLGHSDGDAVLHAVVDAVLGGTAPPVNGHDGRVPVVMARAALRSCQENRPVKLSEIE